jgi:hypothetical protein
MALFGFPATALWTLVFGDLVGEIMTWGVPSLFTVSIMFLTVAFPVAAAASLYVVYRERHAAMNRMAYWHSVLIVAVMVAAAIFMDTGVGDETEGDQPGHPDSAQRRAAGWSRGPHVWSRSPGHWR